MARHGESAAARKRHTVPMTDIRPQAINHFLDAHPIPELQRNILQGASNGVWRTAAKQTWGGQSFTTGLSPETPVPHYNLGSAAMFILKHGTDKVSKMPGKIKESRVKKATRPTTDIFSDRRLGK